VYDAIEQAPEVETMTQGSKRALAGLALVAGSVAAAAGPPPLPFVEGERFPGLLLPSAEDGRPTSIAEFRGSKLVLHVFASW